jgi:hypothetical protein
MMYYTIVNVPFPQGKTHSDYLNEALYPNLEHNLLNHIHTFLIQNFLPKPNLVFPDKIPEIPMNLREHIIRPYQLRCCITFEITPIGNNNEQKIEIKTLSHFYSDSESTLLREPITLYRSNFDLLGIPDGANWDDIIDAYETHSKQCQCEQAKMLYQQATVAILQTKIDEAIADARDKMARIYDVMHHKPIDLSEITEQNKEKNKLKSEKLDHFITALETAKINLNAPYPDFGQIKKFIKTDAENAKTGIPDRFKIFKTIFHDIPNKVGINIPFKTESNKDIDEITTIIGIDAEKSPKNHP